MAIIVTGGAGFIGSCLIRMLNDKGYDDIIVVDNIKSTDKWKNLANKQYLDYFNKDDFLDILSQYAGKVSHIFHMGACSATTERDFDYLYKNNFCYTKSLWDFAIENDASFIYASSAATYGAGENGFDDKGDIKILQPLNGYGYSKQLFDLWVEKQTVFPKQHVGLKFFNVYGTNEYYKGAMASVVMHAYGQIKEKGEVGLFKSYKEGYKDGEQLRDFVYVKDICKVISFMMEHSEVSGLFNLGTGHAESFRILAESTFKALEMTPKIKYIEMPETLRPKYQYYTQANMDKLREAGYIEDFYSLEQGVIDYVQGYLNEGGKTY